MKMLKPWVEPLKVSPEKYDQWIQATPKGVSVTFWALSEKKLSLDHYLNWARDFYEIPSAANEYFLHTPSVELWNTIQSVANWSAQMVPVDQWDGVVFVACTEPPKEVNWSFPVRYILASPHALSDYWNRLHEEIEKTKTMTRSQMQAHQQTVTKAQVSESDLDLNAIDDNSFEGVETSEYTEVEATMADTPSRESQVTTNSTNSDPAALFDQEIEATQNQIEVMDGLDLGTVGEANLELAPQGMGTPDMSPSAATIEELEPEGLSIIKTRLDQSGLGEFSQSETHKQKARPEAAAAPEPTPAQKKPAPAATLSRENSLVGIPNPESADAANNENEVALYFFNKLHKNFIAAQILVYNGENLNLWKWDPQLQPASDEAFQPVDLSRPSVFRIVHRTGMPYHGHMAKSAANNQYFQNWGFAELPESLTLVPLKSGAHMIGMLLCIGTKESFTNQVLIETEKMAAHLLETIQNKLVNAA